MAENMEDALTPWTYGRAIALFIKSKKVSKIGNLHDASKFLALCDRPVTWKAASIDIKTKETTRRALINVDDNDLFASIRCDDGEVKCTIRYRKRQVLEMWQRGDEALGREIFFNILRFLTHKVQFEKAWIRAEYEPFNPVLKHFGRLTFTACEATFVGEGSQRIQEPMYRRWLKMFNFKCEKVVMTCLRSNEVFYPETLEKKVVVVPNWNRNRKAKDSAAGEAPSGDVDVEA